MNIAVVGLGKLGLPLAALYAESHRVFGIDLSPDLVGAVNQGQCPIYEPGLHVKLGLGVESGRLTAHTDFEPISQCEMSLVIVPTPSLPDGAFTSAFVLNAVENICKVLAPTGHRHTIVICSTVMPGECEAQIRPTIEKYDLEVGRDVGLVYSPEFIALGTVLKNMRRPDMILIGESDHFSGEQYETLVRTITGPKPPCHHMSLVSAEIAKIALNSYVTMKISFANVLGEICEKYPEADATQVARAIGEDERVGVAYLQPGGPFGGPCFPRDNRAFALVGDRVEIGMDLARASDAINDRQIERAVKLIEGFGRPKVGIIGASYKVGTRVIEESYGVKLAEEMIRRGYQVTLYDPLNSHTFHYSWDLRIDATNVPASVIGNDMVTIVCTPHKQALSMFPQIFSETGKEYGVVIDPWNCLPEGPWDETHFFRMGRYINAA